MSMLRRRDKLACGRNTQYKERMATAGSGSPSAKVPKEDQDGVDMMPQDDTPAEGRDLGSAAGLNAPDRAGKAQIVRKFYGWIQNDR